MSAFTIFYGAPKPMRAVGANQCRILRFAEKFRGWHAVANDRATRRAISRLHAKGYIEISRDQYRFQYPPQ